MATRTGRRVTGARAGRRLARLSAVVLDPYKPVTAWEARAAVPRGSERPKAPHAALRALQLDPRLAELRADFAGHLCAWLEVHARRAQWADDPARGSVRCISRPSRARVCATTGMSVTTYQRCRRQLEAWGYVGLVRRGWTPLLRASSLTDPGQPNLAAVYVLAVPRRRNELAPPRHRRKPDRRAPASLSRLTDPLTGSPSGVLGDHAREANPEDADTRRYGPLARPSERRAAHFPAHGAALRAAAGQRLSNRGASHLAAPFAAAGWTVAQLRYAVSARPDGSAHPHRAQLVRLPYAWLAHRLRFWLDDQGEAIGFPPAAAAELARRDADRAAQRARRASDEAAKREAADPAPHAAAIRAALGWNGARRGVTSQPTKTESWLAPRPGF